jgi:hypothetical protein
MLPTEAVEEYKKLYQSRFGVVLSDTEASFRANNLVNFYKATLGSESLEVNQTVEEIQQTYEKD